MYEAFLADDGLLFISFSFRCTFDSNDDVLLLCSPEAVTVLVGVFAKGEAYV